MPENPWNTLEAAKLVVGVLIPLSIIWLGWFLTQYLSQFEQQLGRSFWANQKLIERRLELYDDMAPLLNRLLCFYTWVGYWKDISPKEVLDARRHLDKTVNIYLHLLGDEFFIEYRKFLDMLFVPSPGAGPDAKLRSSIRGPYGDRTLDSNYEWDNRWDALFLADGEVEAREKVKAQYLRLMNVFTETIGLAPIRRG
jgi:hypothetical protein